MKKYVEYDNNSSFSYHRALSDTCEVDIHIHDKYEIYQATSDNIRYFVEGSAYDLKAGDLIITSHKEIHRPITIDSNPYGRRFIQFDPLIIQTHIDIDYNPLYIFENRKLGHNNHIVVPCHALSVLNLHFDTIESALLNNSPKSQYESRITMTLLLMEISSLFDSTSSILDKDTLIDPRIYKIRKQLDNHYTESFDLDNLSKSHLIDKYYLSHLFKENTGFTLLEYVQSRRIMLAKSLLKGNQSITEISQQCGYDDYSNFFKTFKKLMKMSPKKYRATLNN